MGNAIVQMLIGGLGQKVLLALLRVALERARVAAEATASPIDDAIVEGVLGALRDLEKIEAA